MNKWIARVINLRKLWFSDRFYSKPQHKSASIRAACIRVIRVPSIKTQGPCQSSHLVSTP
jgi:hypothetical protein